MYLNYINTYLFFCLSKRVTVLYLFIILRDFIRFIQDKHIYCSACMDCLACKLACP